MRRTLLSPALLLVCLTCSFSPPLRAQFTDRESVLLYSVDIGMNPEEVKFVIGRPDAVQAGIPTGPGGKVSLLPQMIEQDRYSSWLYYSNPVNDVEYTGPDTVSIINGETVTSALYSEYLLRDSVYFLDGRILSPREARQYEVWGGPILDVRKIDSMRQNRTPVQRFEVPYQPILFLSFDHITRVVAAKQVFFLRQH